MPEIRFTRSEPWRCPRYKNFFIQDRLAGKDVYGHDTYQYALFRDMPFQEIRRFRTRKQAYEWLSKETHLTRWDIERRNPAIIRNDNQSLAVWHNDNLYRLNKRRRLVEVRPVEDERLTVWHDKYTECLEDAKRVVMKLEVQQEQFEAQAVQMSLFLQGG